MKERKNDKKKYCRKNFTLKDRTVFTVVSVSVAHFTFFFSVRHKLRSLYLELKMEFRMSER